MLAEAYTESPMSVTDNTPWSLDWDNHTRVPYNNIYNVRYQAYLLAAVPNERSARAQRARKRGPGKAWNRGYVFTML